MSRIARFSYVILLVALIATVVGLYNSVQGMLPRLLLGMVGGATLGCLLMLVIKRSDGRRGTGKQMKDSVPGAKLAPRSSDSEP